MRTERGLLVEGRSVAERGCTPAEACGVGRKRG